MRKIILAVAMILAAMIVRGQTVVTVKKTVLPDLDTVVTTTTVVTTVTVETLKYVPPVQIYTNINPVVLTNSSNITYRYSNIPYINLNGCSNITFKHCVIGYISNYNANVDGEYLYNCQNITTDSCTLVGTRTGVNAVQSSGIVVSNCQGYNMQGPIPHGQFVQFNVVSGAGNQIINNKFENVLGQSNPEDAINIYKSNGIIASPILIANNKIRGGGPSKSGSAIMTGDNGGSYIIVKNNVAVDPGQCGMAIAGGSNIQLINNTIYSKQQSFTNVGLYIWYQGVSGGSNTISGNHVYWFNSAGQLNNTWIGDPPNSPPTGWSTNVSDNTLSEATLPNPLTSNLAKP